MAQFIFTKQQKYNINTTVAKMAQNQKQDRV